MPTMSTKLASARGTDRRAALSALTPSDGVGQWSEWNRRYKSKTKAFLDLLDNSVDAAMQPAKQNVDMHVQNDCLSDIEDDTTSQNDYMYSGKIEIEADWFDQSHLGGDDDYESDEDYVDGAPQERTTGVVVTNNSYHPIKALAKVMKTYSSEKGRSEDNFAETVGENGVGLKQACAVMSDLSFVLIHRSDVGGDDSVVSKFSLGIIAKQLQRSEALCLPSVEFDSSDFHSLEEEMLSFFCDKSRRVRCQVRQKSSCCRCRKQCRGPSFGLRRSEH